MKESGWIFQRINSMKISIYKKGELNGSYKVKIPLKSSALPLIKNGYVYSFIWSKLARPYSCEIGNPNGVSIYRQ